MKGTTLSQFRSDMARLSRQLISVATNWRGDETRSSMSVQIKTPTGTGYAIAVRDTANPEILEIARDLYDRIQEEQK